MIVTIKSITTEHGDYGEYRKVTGIDDKGKEVTKNVGDRFQDKWDLLQEGATLDFKMTQKDKKWYIADIIPITESLPSPTKSTILPEHQAEIDKAIGEATVIKKLPEIPGQEIGMTVKEIGDMIRTEKLVALFGLEATVELVKWYRGRILATTRIPYDGSKLPDFKKKETKTE